MKRDKPTQVILSDSLLDGVYVCVGLFHSHPSYARKQISASHLDTSEEFGAPFKCQNQNKWYRSITVPSSAGEIPMIVALVKLQQENTLELKFIMNSTDKKSKTIFTGPYSLNGTQKMSKL